MFVVVYRWKVKELREAEFIEDRIRRGRAIRRGLIERKQA